MKTVKNNNKYNFRLEKFSYKVWSVFAVAFLFAGVLNVNEAFAYFSDSATIDGTTFSAGTLKIVSDPEDTNIIELGNFENYKIINDGSLPFKYDTLVEIADGSDQDFCDELNVIVFDGSDKIYQGSLTGLNSTGTLDVSGEKNLRYMVSRPGINLRDKVCSFNFVSKAGQEELDFTKGFTDTVSSKTVVYSYGTEIPDPSNGVVINEFLPNPDGFEYGFDFGSDTDHMPKGEWVELYNNGETPIDLTGWYLRDNKWSSNKTPINSDHVNGSLVIPAHGWVVFYTNNDVYNNTADSVRLFNKNNELVDSITYGLIPDYCNMKPTPGDNNDSNPSGDWYECLGVPGNKSYARIPDGVGAWIDPIPTPGEANNPSDNLENTLKIEIEATEELIATSTATSTLVISIGGIEIPENIDTSTTTPESVIVPTTTTTEDVIEDLEATSTPEILPSLDIVPENGEEKSLISSIVELELGVLIDVVPEEVEEENAISPAVDTPAEVVEVAPVIAEVCPVAEVSVSNPSENK